MGALAHLLKNRFYIGEVVYRGEVHGGEQAPIVDRALFAAVQAKLAVGFGVFRRARIRSQGTSAAHLRRRFAVVGPDDRRANKILVAK